MPNDRILGEHPSEHPFGRVLTATDGETEKQVFHRALTERGDQRAAAIDWLRLALSQHHADPRGHASTEQLRVAMAALGLEEYQRQVRRFPTSSNTQKGNLAEVVLAEYVVAACGVVLPVYRLRYNPNIDESMKGDDVLAFDLDSDPVRIVVGEAKFRGVSTAVAVTEIVESLLRSHQRGLPASLQFVADRLIQEGKPELGKRVSDCALLFARGELRLDYVGLLLSDRRAGARITSSTPATTKRLAMISLAVDEPSDLVGACYEGLL